MIIYEVNLETHVNNYDELIHWLPGHVGEVLAINGFLNAKILEEVQEEAKERRQITVIYELDNIANLNHYFENQATVMRNKTLEKFGDNIKAKRRVLKLNTILS